MKEVYNVWCEWDIGQEDIIFTNKEEALEFAKECWTLQYMDEEVGKTFEQAIEQGLLSIETKELEW